MPPHAALTRRSLLAGCLAAGVPANRIRAQSGTPVATPAAFSWPAPVDIGDGLEVRDWRLSVDDGPSRFLIEVHNTSNTAVVAPTVGVVLPHFKGDSNYGWANAFTPVIHSRESTFLIGLTPEAVTQQTDFDEAEWTLCDPGKDENETLEKLEGLEYEVESSSVVHRPDWMECAMTVHNTGKKPIRAMRLAGIVRDATGRICGGTAFSNLNNLAGGDSLDMAVHVKPSVDMVASPFVFVSDLAGGSASFSVQPRGAAVNPGCPAVMPWNR